MVGTKTGALVSRVRGHRRRAPPTHPTGESEWFSGTLQA